MDAPFVRIPVECLSQVFRKHQKTVTKELTSVADDVVKLWSSDGTLGGLSRRIVFFDTVCSLETTEDALRIIGDKGFYCRVGELHESYGSQDWSRVDQVYEEAKARGQAAYHGGVARQYQAFCDKIAAGLWKSGIDKVWTFEEVRDAHVMMDANKMCGKSVVVIE